LVLTFIWKTRSGVKFSCLLDAVASGVEAVPFFVRAFKKADEWSDEGDSDDEHDDATPIEDTSSPPDPPTCPPSPSPTCPPSPSPSAVPTDDSVTTSTSTTSHSRYPKRLASAHGKIEKVRSKERGKRRRSEKVAKQRSLLAPNQICYHPRLSNAERLVIMPSKTDFDPLDLPVASGCWIGKRMGSTKESQWTVPELKDIGFIVLPWDGKYVFFIYLTV
jgi:hypothetical protein